MDVGYVASPLHRIIYLDTSGSTSAAIPDDDSATKSPSDIPGTYKVIRRVPVRLRSPPKADILAWRDRIASRYRDHLGEDLSWNEDSDFEQSEGATTDDNLMLLYIAAILDQHGPDAARVLAGTTMPPYAEMALVFAETDRRGFAGRFPQLLLNARYWLPFERHLIIEEPDWRGTVARYGSAPRLADELEEVRAFIAAAEPKAAARPADGTFPPKDVLAGAWRASEVAARVCAVAVAQHLPLWTTR